MKINFKITSDCPANCQCCQERLRNYKLYPERLLLHPLVIERILQLFIDSGDSENTLSISGGEPSIVPELSNIVSFFSAKGIRVGIDTNGWNVTETWLRQMEQAGLDYLLLSFYSSNKSLYNMLRGSAGTDLFQRAEQAISAISRLKAAGCQMEARLQVTLMKGNYQELPLLLQIALENHFDTLSTAYYISAKEDPTNTLDEKDIMLLKSDIVYQVKCIMRDSMSDSLISTNIERISQFFNFSGVSTDRIAHGFFRNKNEMCHDNHRLVVYPNGDVVPCTGFDYIMDTTQSLNIIDHSYKEIINSRIFAEFWINGFPLCERCSSGHQIWLDLKYTPKTNRED